MSDLKSKLMKLCATRFEMSTQDYVDKILKLIEEDRAKILEIDEKNKRIWFIVPEKYRGKYSVMTKGF